jgi:hypothetical protein
MGLAQGCDPGSHARRDGAECIAQLGACNTNERIGLSPQRREFDLAQYFALLVAELPTTHDGTCAPHGDSDAKAVEHAHRIGLHGDSRAGRLLAGVAFDELRGDPASMQRGRQAAAGDAGADNQNPSGYRHG